MKVLLVTKTDDKQFRVTVPDDVKITFGPWSPPPKKPSAWESGDKVGTLRIYDGKTKNILAVFAHVASFRDLSLGFAEQVAKEEGATIWKDDQEGYVREDKRSVKKEWIEGPALPPAPPAVTKRRGKGRG